MRFWNIIFLLSIQCFAENGSFSTPRAESAAVIIRTPTGGGSGFLVKMDGETYIVTNQHVVYDSPASSIKMHLIDGTQLIPKSAEISDVDLIRFPISTTHQSLTLAESMPSVNSPIATIGNSLDANVITANVGTLKGVGPEEIEIDCDMVSGNSGGPVVDENQNVIGVSTYVRFGNPDISTEGTRYRDVRRFALRLNGSLKWSPVAEQWRRYSETGQQIAKAESLLDELHYVGSRVFRNDSLEGFQPAFSKVAEAITGYDRLEKRKDKMLGQRATTQELERNNKILASTYRNIFQKLRDGCRSEAESLSRVTLPPEWKWMESRRREVLGKLSEMEVVFDEQFNSKPKFLTF